MLNNLLSTISFNLFFKIILLLIIIIIIITSFYSSDYFINMTGIITNGNNKYNKVAFIIPIHKPHFNFIYNFLKKNNQMFDVYLVFSNYSDYESFELKHLINAVIFDEVKTKSIVTYKKWSALKKLKDLNYEYFIVCDAEIDLIENNFNTDNVYSKLNDFFNNKKIFGGIVNDNGTKNITDHCTNIFNKDDKEKLKTLTSDYKLYCWWSDIPVYKRSTLDKFFLTIDFENKDLNYSQFDNLIYNFYLVLYENFTFVNVTDEIDWKFSLETLYTNDTNKLNKLKNLGYGFNWVIKKQYYNMKEFYNSSKTFILYHLDRY